MPRRDPERTWVVKVAHKDGKSSFLCDKRDGLTYVPRYRSKSRAKEKNAFLWGRHSVGTYVIKRVRRAKLQAFEKGMNARHNTPEARELRKREEEVSQAAAVLLKKIRREKKRT